MIVRQIVITTGALLAAIVLYGSSAQALSMKECSAKYKAAKEAGTLNGMKWNDFRKAQCGADASAFSAAISSGHAAAESDCYQACSRSGSRRNWQRGISQRSFAQVLG
jgi:hypothetical protein